MVYQTQMRRLGRKVYSPMPIQASRTRVGRAAPGIFSCKRKGGRGGGGRRVYRVRLRGIFRVRIGIYLVTIYIINYIIIV